MQNSFCLRVSCYKVLSNNCFNDQFLLEQHYVNVDLHQLPDYLHVLSAVCRLIGQVRPRALRVLQTLSLVHLVLLMHLFAWVCHYSNIIAYGLFLGRNVALC